MLTIAGECSLKSSVHLNWIDKAGGLPSYICEIARAIIRGGSDLESAIPIAVSRCEAWASGVGVSKKTQVKAAAAVAQWEAMRADAHAKGLIKASAIIWFDSCIVSLPVGVESLLRLTFCT